MEEINSSNNPYPVMPTGYLLGSYLALALYGVHTSQVIRYFSRHRDTLKLRLLVCWIYLLSTLQIIIILLSSHQYYVHGIEDRKVWGTFWWPLSFQDGLIPLMAFTAQLYFGRRAWLLTGKKPWMIWATSILATITFICGVALAITAHIWSDDPFVTPESFASRNIGIPSQAVAITWMGLSAFTDGCITLLLIFRFRQARRNSTFYSTRHLVKKMIALTMETVLLTHLVGATMCIIFLASPAAHRTKNNVFWILLESITELYALSIVFTINSRTPTAPPTPQTILDNTDEKEGDEDGRDKLPMNMAQTALDYHVEGYQGSTPFGVRAVDFQKNGQYQNRSDGSGGSGGTGNTRSSSSRTEDTLPSPFTPMDELQYFPGFTSPVQRRMSMYEDIDEKGEK
ncbi:hypothetical protein I302_104626 [Kwoniella bestiolae CBS 10118]|uniref:DUF6534 domain-containing protein n=1 Tax=Kwoniella bestiolae CBS 10118 TaxID=1296100 RepID=A0A1B9GBU8_9TREE|nr:hypothetical protein I302_03334 [Kwoniella bestiolae CBS 10118]OCF28475.1 hypothetical protein I302_03334 [Kwoniella bestiolae CBS 10118]